MRRPRQATARPAVAPAELTLESSTLILQSTMVASDDPLPTPAPGRAFRFAVDRGGTFTDVYCTYATSAGTVASLVVKLLSDDPANYPDAPREGIRRALARATGAPHPRDTPLDTARILSIRMGTTVATNALLERTGARCALVTTAGFRDLLHIGSQARPAIFDLAVAAPEVLHCAVVEVDELVVLPLGSVPGARAGPTAGTATVTSLVAPQRQGLQQIGV